MRAELVATTSVSVPKCEREEEGEREDSEEEWVVEEEERSSGPGAQTKAGWQRRKLGKYLYLICSA